MNASEILLLPPDLREQLIARMHGLTVACPFDQANPPDCPICNIRKLPLKARIEWVHSLSSSVMEEMMQHHANCLFAKEHPGAPKPPARRA